MNLSSNWKTIVPATGLAALLIWGIAGQNKSVGAGSLTPPPGTPAPTMPTLQEIADKVDTLGSSGKNIGLRFQSKVQVWNGETGQLSPERQVTGLQNLIESDGNFCALGSSRGYAWNKMTNTWSETPNSISGASSLTQSNGNFCLVGASRAAAWIRRFRHPSTRAPRRPDRTFSACLR